MKKALDPKDMLGGETADPAGGPNLQERGDVLATDLAQRLQKHIMSRCPSKKDHWVWDFVLDNMTRMAVIMEHMGHIRRDADIAHIGKKDDRCLLKKPEAFIPLLLDFSEETTSELKSKKGAIYITFRQKEFGFGVGKWLVGVSKSGIATTCEVQS
jgi:hypothetical protein